MRFGRRFLLFAVGCAAICGLAFATEGSESGRKLLTGQAAMDDWTGDAPGVRRKLTVADLPSPSASRSASNFPTIVSRPRDAQLHVPDGFRIEEYAAGLRDPRVLLTAPNGDIFVTESRANQIKVMRDKDGDGKPDTTQIFSEAQLNKPFGIAFYPPGNDPQYLYVANTDGVIRFPYRNGDLEARGPGEKLGAHLSPGGLLRGGGHWTAATFLAASTVLGTVSRRTGYKIVRVPMDGGKAQARQYEDFVTGFVTREGNVWGRPVGVTVAKDGSLLFSEDGHGTIWRVSRESA